MCEEVFEIQLIPGCSEDAQDVTPLLLGAAESGVLARFGKDNIFGRGNVRRDTKNLLGLTTFKG